MTRFIVFDLDDTLYPEHDFVRSGFRAVDAALERDWGIRGFYDAAEALFREGRRGDIFDLALQRLEARSSREMIMRLVEVYRRHPPQLTLFEDAAWALSELEARYGLGILTDGYLQTQRNKVEALGLEPRVRSVVYSDELGRENWKPSEVPYLTMMKRADSPGSRFIYVADNPAKDFVAPRRLGWETFRIRREGGEYSRLEAVDEAHRAEHDVRDLRQLVTLL